MQTQTCLPSSIPRSILELSVDAGTERYLEQGMLGRHFSACCYSEYNVWPWAELSISGEASSLPASGRASRRRAEVLALGWQSQSWSPACLHTVWGRGGGVLWGGAGRPKKRLSCRRHSDKSAAGRKYDFTAGGMQAHVAGLLWKHGAGNEWNDYKPSGVIFVFLAGTKQRREREIYSSGPIWATWGRCCCLLVSVKSVGALTAAGDHEEAIIRSHQWVGCWGGETHSPFSSSARPKSCKGLQGSNQSLLWHLCFCFLLPSVWTAESWRWNYQYCRCV